ncbi:MAG: hypothetical protein IT292_11670 [Deltaproteobacteria bacterium]|nr:hypothetical protein [Deltaproteobacteria bacterium]
MSMIDISNEKRRNALERVFFHDVLNVVGSLHGISSVLAENNDFKEIKGFTPHLQAITDEITLQIKEFRQLSSAEKEDLQVKISIIDAMLVLQQLKRTFMPHPIFKDKILAVDIRAEKLIHLSDSSLLSRILGNVVKNAAEASVAGGKISISCNDLGDKVLYQVHHVGVISRNVQMQIFLRSFSTHSSNRGLGTYSMKLFGKNYLGGKVCFKSDEATGTTFYLELPKEYQMKAKRAN